MTTQDDRETALRLGRWARALRPTDAGALPAKLSALDAAFRSVHEIVDSLSEKLSIDESADALSQLHVWLNDEVGPRIAEVLRLSEPIEGALHSRRELGE